MLFAVYFMLIQCRTDDNLQSLIAKKFLKTLGQMWLRGTLCPHPPYTSVLSPTFRSSSSTAQHQVTHCLCHAVWVEVTILLGQDI